MDIEKIIRAWKAEEDEWETSLFASPVGVELTEEELLDVSGGDSCVITVCTYSCNVTCNVSCVGSICEVTNCGTTNFCGAISACSCSLSGASGV